MKLKTLLIALVALFAATSVSARDRYSNDINVLPQAAQNLLSTHFPNVQVNHIKIDKHTFGGEDYDVVLNNGTEIDFDSKGNLEEVDCGRTGKVPNAIVPEAIRNYVHLSLIHI